MGPDEEPGEAKPPKADESRGLGGIGTEGGPGEPGSGMEEQIPPDILNAPLPKDAAERIANPPQKGEKNEEAA